MITPSLFFFQFSGLIGSMVLMAIGASRTRGKIQSLL